jgi:Mrp family chromosome partitioning ATPase
MGTAPADENAVTLIDRLRERQLVVVTGKGGVGKTVLSAALAQGLSAAGARVLLLELDPRESLHHLLDAPPSGGEVVQVRPRILLHHLDPRVVLEKLVRERLPVPMLARKVIASPIFRHFTDGAPGLKEMAVLGHALRVVRGQAKPAVDVVVLDAPATGHGVSLLAAPLLVSDVIARGPIGDLAREVADFVADPDRCGTIIGTLAEELPVQEALELIGMLRSRLNRTPEAVIVNGVYPRPPREGARTPPGTAAAVALWRRRRRVNQREVARLAKAWTGPRIEIPLLPIDRGPDLVAAVAARLEAAPGSGGRRR